MSRETAIELPTCKECPSDLVANCQGCGMAISRYADLCNPCWLQWRQSGGMLGEKRIMGPLLPDRMTGEVIDCILREMAFERENGGYREEELLGPKLPPEKEKVSRAILNSLGRRNSRKAEAIFMPQPRLKEEVYEY